MSDEPKPEHGRPTAVDRVMQHLMDPQHFIGDGTITGVVEGGVAVEIAESHAAAEVAAAVAGWFAKVLPMIDTCAHINRDIEHYGRAVRRLGLERDAALDDVGELQAEIARLRAEVEGAHDGQCGLDGELCPTCTAHRAATEAPK